MLAKRVNAVVLNYNQHEAALRCVNELRASTGIEVDVLVVDCASEPRDQQQLRANLPADRLLLLPENVGYAGGMNAGVEFWLKHDPDAGILLVTPDARIESNVVEALWQALAADEKVAAAGPVIIYREEPDKKIAAGGEIRAGRLTMNTEVRGSTPYDVGWIEGCCMLLRPNALRAVGGICEDYFLYFEDADLCVQLERAGWRIQVVPGACVRHLKPIGQQPPHYYYYNARNSYRFWSRNFNVSTVTTGARLVTSVAWLTAIALASLMLPGRWREARGRWRDARLALQGAWAGTRDHLNGRYGRSAPTTRPK